MGRSGKSGDLVYVDISSMGQFGFTRYRVTLRGERLGEVFSFRSDTEASSVVWAGQATDGTLRGWVLPFRTRAEAGQALLPRKGRS